MWGCPEIGVGAWLSGAGRDSSAGLPGCAAAPAASGVRCGTPGVVRKAPYFLAESGEAGVVVLISMCNRPVDCVGLDWTLKGVKRAGVLEKGVDLDAREGFGGWTHRSDPGSG